MERNPCQYEGHTFTIPSKQVEKVAALRGTTDRTAAQWDSARECTASTVEEAIVELDGILALGHKIGIRILSRTHNPIRSTLRADPNRSKKIYACCLYPNRR